MQKSRRDASWQILVLIALNAPWYSINSPDIYNDDARGSEKFRPLENSS
jgi:hypothetical protein